MKQKKSLKPQTINYSSRVHVNNDDNIVSFVIILLIFSVILDLHVISSSLGLVSTSSDDIASDNYYNDC